MDNKLKHAKLVKMWLQTSIPYIYWAHSVRYYFKCLSIKCAP